ncbi:N-acetylmuramoyl-L-alanine amidase [Paenibacillus sp. YN15]|uniref:N-acetylmuramoyl-L-alanine amidase n=1 Tax=Paenibacillus sp. YN15 TaxID=1742774 RepID=UPI000DCCDFB8|nr:N-acetylmuramoyl-L-alanine amidase [Paenibacillus sp. YN15]RAV06376.1 N-acetylmuramoyl-L-alanine amidase [Paenibacillus sp. YN15]
MITGLLILGFAIAQPAPAWAEAVKIVLDAGHGGSDPGAVGVNGLYEKTVNFDVVERVKAILESRGYEVLLTRDSDVYLSLAERVAITNRLAPDLFVSVHANAHTNSSISGSMVLYYDKDYPQASYPASDAMAALTPESKRLAQLVQDAMVKSAGTVDRGLVPSAVYVARMGSVPSILVETAFLSNAGEAANLADPDFRQKLAAGIAEGIEAYKPMEEPGAFADVPLSHWANDAILKLKNKGILEGEAGKYYPERALTRAEFVTMLERQFSLPEPAAAGSGVSQGGSTVTGSTYGTGSGSSSGTGAAAAPVFKDLPATHWAYAVMQKAAAAGILSGYADGTIRPDQPLTRGEAAALIDRVIWPGSSQKATSTVFQDVPVSLWSAASINRLKEKGIVEGATATTFAPERSMTRAEMAALLSRLIR